MVVDESASFGVVQFVVCITVHPIQEEAFKEVVPHQKEDDERDDEYESGVRCQLRDLLVRHHGHPGTAAIEFVIETSSYDSRHGEEQNENNVNIM